MVNENQGKTYEPGKTYCRRMARTVVRNQMIQRYGYHKTSDLLHNWWVKAHEKTKKKKSKARR